MVALHHYDTGTPHVPVFVSARPPQPTDASAGRVRSGSNRRKEFAERNAGMDHVAGLGWMRPSNNTAQRTACMPAKASRN